MLKTWRPFLRLLWCLADGATWGILAMFLVGFLMLTRIETEGSGSAHWREGSYVAFVVATLFGAVSAYRDSSAGPVDGPKVRAGASPETKQPEAGECADRTGGTP
jgi:hypothetical protein